MYIVYWYIGRGVTVGSSLFTYILVLGYLPIYAIQKDIKSASLYVERGKRLGVWREGKGSRKGCGEVKSCPFPHLYRQASLRSSGTLNSLNLITTHITRCMHADNSIALLLSILELCEAHHMVAWRRT